MDPSADDELWRAKPRPDVYNKPLFPLSLTFSLSQSPQSFVSQGGGDQCLIQWSLLVLWGCVFNGVLEDIARRKGRAGPLAPLCADLQVRLPLYIQGRLHSTELGTDGTPVSCIARGGSRLEDCLGPVISGFCCSLGVKPDTHAFTMYLWSAYRLQGSGDVSVSNT